MNKFSVVNSEYCEVEDCVVEIDDSKFRPMIDNVPPGGAPIYDVPINSYILEYQDNKLTTVHIRADRHSPNLTPINAKNLIGVGKALQKLEKMNVWDKSVIVSIVNDHIGLMCTSRKSVEDGED